MKKLIIAGKLPFGDASGGSAFAYKRDTRRRRRYGQLFSGCCSCETKANVAKYAQAYEDAGALGDVDDQERQERGAIRQDREHWGFNDRHQ